jgi:hypothetical protein
MSIVNSSLKIELHNVKLPVLAYGDFGDNCLFFLCVNGWTPIGF